MIKDLVTIVVPVYNVEKFLPDCFDSIKSQTYKKIEVIFVNDGSTDNSKKMLEEFCRENSYAKLINQENKGLSAARNTGVANMSGEYLCFFDSDDIIHPYLIETFIKYFNKYNVDFIGSNYRKVNEDFHHSNIHNFSLKEHKFNLLNGDKMRAMFISHWKGTENWNVWNKCFKYEILKKIPTFPKIADESISIGEDLFIVSNFLSVCNSAISVNMKYYYYRKRAGSLMRNGFDKRKINLLYATAPLLKSSKIKEESITYKNVRILQCRHALDLMWNINKNKYSDKAVVNFVYKEYRENLKYSSKSKYQPWWVKLLPLTLPVIKSFYKKIIKRD